MFDMITHRAISVSRWASGGSAVVDLVSGCTDDREVVVSSIEFDSERMHLYEGCLAIQNAPRGTPYHVSFP
ncbi:hypothetical protein RIU97_38735 [Streptomyces sp. 147326]